MLRVCSLPQSVCVLIVLLYTAQVLFNKETEEIVGVHIIGLHAADLIQECSNAVAAGTTVRELSMMVRDTDGHMSRAGVCRCWWNSLLVVEGKVVHSEGVAIIYIPVEIIIPTERADTRK